MSPVRISLLLAAVIGLTGCYDLSAPSGPSPDDFAKNRAVSAADPDDDPTCTTGDDCPSESALTTRAARPLGVDLSNDVVFANDAAQHGLQAPAK